MQLRRLAALERQKIVDELAEIEREIADPQDILARPERQRTIVRDELTEIVDKHGDDRRTQIVADDGDVTNEDLIAVEDVVVTITQTGYAKRTKTDLYRAQKRGGKACRARSCGRTTSSPTSSSAPRTTDPGSSRTRGGYGFKAYELPEANRSARPARGEPPRCSRRRAHCPGHADQGLPGGAVPRAGHAHGPGEEVAAGRISTRTAPAASSGSTCVTTTSWSARCCAPRPTTSSLVSAEGQSIRFTATDEALRPMGRATSGVLGMRFNSGDRLLSLAVVRPDTFLLVATAGGYAKRTPIEDYLVQGRWGGKGVLTLQYDRRRGTLVGALIVGLDDELYAITSTGGVIRPLREVRKAGRQTKGVRLMNLGERSTLLAVARNAEDDAVDTDADPHADPRPVHEPGLATRRAPP